MTSTVTDDEIREQHIAECGRQFIAARGRGDHRKARQWLDMQTQAIKRRSPEQVARMERARGIHGR